MNKASSNPKKSNPKSKVEKPKGKNQQISKKKEEVKHHAKQPLNFPQKAYCMSFKRIHKLPKPSSQARLICYIPERNLLLIVLINLQTIKIYNTNTFSLIAVKKTREEVECISYCPKLGKIIVGGDDEFLQLWNPITFKVEAQCLKRNNNHSIRSIAYLPEPNVIVAILDNQVRIYNKELRCSANIKMHFYSEQRYPQNTEVVSLSKNLFATFRIDGNRKVPIMFNLDTKSYREFLKEVYIPITSCVEMTENNPKNVFSCLGMFNGKPSKPEDENTVYQLIQFTIDTKMDELLPVKNNNISTHSFSKLNKIENSKYFLAERLEKDVLKTYLLSLTKSQVEILKVISTPSQMILGNINTYIMLKDGVSLVEIDSNYRVSVFKSEKCILEK